MAYPLSRTRLAAASGLTLLLWAGLSAGASGPCQLLVTSTPKGAKVILDGKEVGVTPLPLAGLTAGKHELRVTLDGHRPWYRQVVLRPGYKTIAAALESLTPAQAAPPPAQKEQPAPSEAGPGPTAPDTVEATCPACGGDGLLDEIGCARCGGSGYVSAEKCTDCAASARVPYKCPACLGNGKVPTTAGRELDCPYCRSKGAPPCLMCKGSGVVRRQNPEAAPFPTMGCQACDGIGFVTKTRCKRCGGKGVLTLRRARRVGLGRRTLAITVQCPACGGDGIRPPQCQSCSGRGYAGEGQYAKPCRTCSGTGNMYRRCPACRGLGWVRDRTR